MSGRGRGGRSGRGGHRRKILSPILMDCVLVRSWSTCPKRTWRPRVTCHFSRDPGGGKIVENPVVVVSRSTRIESDQFSAEQRPQAISVVVLNDL
eukprot:scaffold3672_cov86-Cylindrotheca_fusiformis.AAC.2